MHARLKMQLGCGGFLLAMAGAMLLPRVAARGSDGLAAAGAAALAFLVCLALALGLAVYVLAVSVRQRADLSTRLRATALVPIVLWLICLAGVVYAIRAKSQALPEKDRPHASQTTLHQP